MAADRKVEILISAPPSRVSVNDDQRSTNVNDGTLAQ